MFSFSFAVQTIKGNTCLIRKVSATSAKKHINLSNKIEISFIKNFVFQIFVAFTNASHGALNGTPFKYISRFASAFGKRFSQAPSRE